LFRYRKSSGGPSSVKIIANHSDWAKTSKYRLSCIVHQIIWFTVAVIVPVYVNHQAPVTVMVCGSIPIGRSEGEVGAETRSLILCCLLRYSGHIASGLYREYYVKVSAPPFSDKDNSVSTCGEKKV